MTDNFYPSFSYDDDLIDMMRWSGCTTLTFGVESGSDRVLSIIKKDLVVEFINCFMTSTGLT